MNAEPTPLSARAALLRHVDTELATMNAHADRLAQYQPRYVVASRKRRSLTDGERIALVTLATAIITALLVL